MKYFIPTQPFVALIPSFIYFTPISFRPSYVFHWLPDIFYSCFISISFIFHIYFLPTQLFISLVARFISFLLHFYFFPPQLFISLVARFISFLFHFYFFPAKLFVSFISSFISLVFHSYFVSISFLPSCLFLIPSFISFPYCSHPATWNWNEIDMKQEWNISGNQWNK